MIVKGNTKCNQQKLPSSEPIRLPLRLRGEWSSNFVAPPSLLEMSDQEGCSEVWFSLRHRQGDAFASILLLGQVSEAQLQKHCTGR